MKTKHTPSPWYIDRDGFSTDNGLVLRAKNWKGIGQPIGEVYTHEPDSPRGEEAEANGTLMEAAPELLESLIKIEECLNDGIPITKNDPFHSLIKALIQKATS